LRRRFPVLRSALLLTLLAPLALLRPQEAARTGGNPKPNAPPELTPRPPLALDAAACDALAARIDERIAAEWRAAGLTPTPATDDATWLRRLSLDLRGLIPTAAEVATFLADPAPAKRARTIDAFLASDEFARHLSYLWCNILFSGGPRERLRTEALLRPWLEEQFRQRVPFATIVEGIVASSEWSRFTSCTSFVLTYQDSIEELAGAVARSFLGLQIQCAQCHDHKFDNWTQAQFNRFAGFFLDVRSDHTVGPGGKSLFRIIDHSPEWDFQERLNKMVAQARRGSAANAGAMAGGMAAAAMEREMAAARMDGDDGQVFAEDILGSKGVPGETMAPAPAPSTSQFAALEELQKASRKAKKRDNALAELEADPARLAALMEALPTDARELVLRYQARRANFTQAGFLDDQEWNDDGSSRRKALADWIAAPANPWYGRAVANRVVSQLFGTGFVEPVDDLTGAGDRVLEELHGELAAAFAAQGDLRLLYGALARSRAYGLSSLPPAARQDALPALRAERRYAAHPLQPMTAEQLLFSLQRATSPDGTAMLLPTDSVEFRTEQSRKSRIDQLKGNCIVDVPTGNAEYEPTIPAALFLINGDATARAGLLADDPELAALFDPATPPAATAIDALFRRTLSRPASTEEQAAFAASLSDPAVPRLRALEDVFWALLNATEFHTCR